MDTWNQLIQVKRLLHEDDVTDIQEYMKESMPIMKKYLKPFVNIQDAINLFKKTRISHIAHALKKFKEQVIHKITLYIFKQTGQHCITIHQTQERLLKGIVYTYRGSNNLFYSTGDGYRIAIEDMTEERKGTIWKALADVVYNSYNCPAPDLS